MLVENSNSQNVNYIITSCQRGTSQGSYRIFLEDGSSFFISIDFFIEHKLKKGLSLSPELLFLIEEESKYVEAYTKAISLLSRQLYTSYNLKRKLLSKEHDVAIVDRVILKLESKDLLDDRKYAESWVLGRLRTKLDSYNTLLSGLIKKGIPNNIAKDILFEHYNDELESIIIKKIVDKCCRVGKSSDKIKESLLRKGFNRNKVFYFLNNIGSFNEGD